MKAIGCFSVAILASVSLRTAAKAEQVETSPNAEAASPSPPSGESSERAPVETIIVGTPSPAGIAVPPELTTVLSQEEVQTQMQTSRDIGEALGKTVPGLTLSSLSLSNIGQTIRGRPVLVMIDGVPQSSNRNSFRDFATLSPSAIERVEVIRGATSRYGEGAAGGIIHFITLRPAEEEIQFRTDLSLDGSVTHPAKSLGGSLSQTASGKRGRYSYLLAGSVKRTGRFFDAEGDLIPPDPFGQGGVSETDGFSVLAKGGMELTPTQQLQLTVSHFQSSQWTELSADPAVNSFPPGTRKSQAIGGLELADPQASRNTFFNFEYRLERPSGKYLRGQLYYRDFFTRFFPFQNPLGLYQARLNTRKAGARLEGGIRLPFRLSLLGGAELSRENSVQPVSAMDPAAFAASGGRAFIPAGTRDFFPRVHLLSLAPFVQLEWEALPPLSLRAGVRQEFIRLWLADSTSLLGASVPGGGKSYHRPLFNAGAAYKMAKELTVFFNFSQGQGIPDVGLILRTAPPGSSFETLNLGPQIVNFYEAGVRLAKHDWEASSSVYLNTCDLGYSIIDPRGTGVRAPERIYGLDANIDYRPPGAAKAGAGFTWLEGQLDLQNNGHYTFLNGVRIPPLKLTGYVEYAPLRKWRTRLYAVFSGERNRFPGSTAFTERQLKSFFLVDLTSDVDIGPGTLRIGLANLTNRMYFSRASALVPTGFNTSYSAAPGTTLSLGYSLVY
jgi:iron complex outermembrane receptor protein